MKPAAIQGSLVNMRNVGTHKSVALTVHVPEELAQRVIEAFGWPTAAAPVAVALARLNPASSNGRTPDFESVNAGSTPAAGTKERRRFSELPPAQQAALKCQDEAFRRFMVAEYNADSMDENCVVRRVREFCGVASRSTLNTDRLAEQAWNRLLHDFNVWMQDVDA